MKIHLTCPRYKGKGRKIEIDWFFGVLTCGITLLIDLSNPETCTMCEGKGYVIRKY